MEKQKLTIDNLLSWEDFIALGDPNGDNKTTISYITLEQCCRNNYDRSRLDELYTKYVLEPFTKEFDIGNADPKMFNLRLKFTNIDNKIKLTYSKIDVVVAIIAIFAPIIKRTHADLELFEKIEKDLYTAKNDEELKEKTIKYLKNNKIGYIRLINEIRDTEPNYIPGSIKSKEILLQTFIEGRDKINSFIKNIDYLFEYLDKDFSLEVLEAVDKDKLMLFLSCMCSCNDELHNMLEGDLDKDRISPYLEDESIISFLRYVNNYTLIIKYIEEENKAPYDVNTRVNMRDRNDDKFIDIFLASNKTIAWFTEFKEIVSEIPEIKEKLNFYDSYEDLLRDKASKTWKEIENKRFARNIKLNFEMIKSGPKIGNFRSDAKNLLRITSNKEKRQAKLKRDYDILDEKIDFYENHKGVAHGVGINNFTGYFAEFYPNGSVVLDKLFRYQTIKRGPDKGKEVVVPASDEAIYIMNYKEFADLSKYTKMELIQEIKDFDNTDVKRIYHSIKWKENVLKEINGEGYGGLDLELLNMLTESLTSEKEKSL